MTSSVIRAMICPTKRNGAAMSLLPAYAEELLKHYPVFNEAEAILEIKGNIKLEWEWVPAKNNYSCKLETGEEFHP